MNEDAITIIEADGLFLELLPIRPDGLYGPEQAALSMSFISYAQGQLLKRPKIEPYNKGIVEKAKTALEAQQRETSA